MHISIAVLRTENKLCSSPEFQLFYSIASFFSDMRT